MKIRDKIRKITTGVKFLTREKKIIDKEEVMSILPHRGRFLFLDRVIITAEKIIGEFTVTEEVCHEIWGKLVFRGVDYLEMAAQLLGIWLAQQATQHPNLNRKLVYLRKASFKCINPAFPGDLLRIEIFVREGSEEEEGNPRIESIGSEDRPGRLRQQVICVNAEVWVNDKKKAVIYFVELSIVDAPKLS